MDFAGAASWAWIPIVIWAALAQTARNAAQRSLTAQAGTLGATLVRFLYGLPFAAAWVAILHALPGTAQPLPGFTPGYFGWIVLGGLSQIAATAFLLAAMKERNFVVAVAFSKTEVLQVALFASIFLGELPGLLSLLAIALASIGVLLVSAPKAGEAAGAVKQWGKPMVVYGLASGAGFALSAVGYRGAALELAGASAWLTGAWGVLWAQAIQTAVLGGWIALRQPQALRAVVLAWRISLVAGGAGALASIGWFTAFALRPAADVRTLGLIEVFFSYLVSRRLLREDLALTEQIGLGLLVAGVLLVCLQL
jgi:drug/metabolite transporter (DMT)-like permease